MPEPDRTPTGLEARVLKGALQYLGVFSGGGAGFAALSFGVGYLAVKSHDAMLGLPTATTHAESYVRVGALFFPNSLYYAVSVVTRTSIKIWAEYRPGLYGLVLATIFVWFLSSSTSGKKLREWLRGRRVGRVIGEQLERYKAWATRARPAGLTLAYLMLTVLAFVAVEQQTASLHSINKGLLLNEPVAAGKLESYGLAGEIHGYLRKSTASVELQRLFGKYLLYLMTMSSIALWLFRVGRRQAYTPASGWLSTNNWMLRPVTYTLLVTQLVLLPSTYGVLCVSNLFPCVETITDEERQAAPLKGYLLSDLTVSEPQVVVLAWSSGESHWKQQVFRRSELEALTIVTCPPMLGSGVAIAK